jgi:hypothetical protein
MKPVDYSQINVTIQRWAQRGYILRQRHMALGYNHYAMNSNTTYSIRKPLFDYTNYCYNRGTLTDNFRSAKIRLIPKKGDLTKLSNWRPISLLNCFYKIISRVIATRLRKVMDKITKVSHAQNVP